MGVITLTGYIRSKARPLNSLIPTYTYMHTDTPFPYPLYTGYSILNSHCRDFNNTEVYARESDWSTFAQHAALTTPCELTDRHFLAMRCELTDRLFLATRCDFTDQLFLATRCELTDQLFLATRDHCNIVGRTRKPGLKSMQTQLRPRRKINS